jgi:hypothetical protein
MAPALTVLSSESQDIFLLSQIMYKNVNEGVKTDKLLSSAIYFLHVVWYPMALVFIAGGAASGVLYCKNVNIYSPVRCLKQLASENCQIKEIFSASSLPALKAWLNHYYLL